MAIPMTNRATASESGVPDTTASKIRLMPRTPQVTEKGRSGRRQFTVIKIIVTFQRLNGESHRGPALTVPAHVIEAAVTIMDKFDIAAAAVKKDKVVLGNQLLSAACQDCQFIDIPVRETLAVVPCCNLSPCVPDPAPCWVQYRVAAVRMTGQETCCMRCQIAK